MILSLSTLQYRKKTLLVQANSQQLPPLQNYLPTQIPYSVCCRYTISCRTSHPSQSIPTLTPTVAPGQTLLAHRMVLRSSCEPTVWVCHSVVTRWPAWTSPSSLTTGQKIKANTTSCAQHSLYDLLPKDVINLKSLSSENCRKLYE